jgi:S1-C subfamily serine protease
MKPWKLFVVLDVVVLAAAGVAWVTLHGGSPRTVRTGVVLVDAHLGHGIRTEGTGIVLTRGGEVLTNHHVIEGATSVRVKIPETGKTYDAEILGYDVHADAALLKLDGAHGLRTAPVLPGGPRVGQKVLAVGGATGSVKFSVGHVTGLGASVSAGDELSGGNEQLKGLIEFDAAIQPGDSGGPLIDLRGNVLGIDTAGGSKAGFFQLINRQHVAYAIPIRSALGVVHRIERGQQSASLHVGATAFLGIELDPTSISAGADVAGAVKGSPAAVAGLRAGAHITGVDGVAISEPEQLVAQLLAKHPGDSIALDWSDAAGRHTATIVLVPGPAL